ncbi:MAG: VWA domain-containing protein [Methylotenera sp.]|nr:VWA domain-containing protein [Methylotenera sp.]MDP1754706.1 VWA domain-containing protein [Methylotenera sp.]MDP1958744.1 VWA domain-containing protein [Methylotenera sp.]MDP3207199.1 VWA domain-containing protein [Methylotenera sp.]MDP3303656.1 VWA domain-containing protein [Methylotenera sp.]
MAFLTPWAFLLLPIALLPFWLKGHQGKGYTWLEMLPEDKLSDRLNWGVKVITSLLLVSIVIALASPRGHDEKVQRTGKGAQTVMVMDRSVSMDHPFTGDNSGNVAEIKSAAARRIITQFIDSRPHDMMGVVGFTNSALYGVKITTNRDAIHAAIIAATSPSLNQTNIGAGLTEGLGLFDKIENSGSRALILLSDGAGKLSPRVKFLLSQRLKERKLSIYWIMLREPGEPSIFSKEVYEEDRVPNSIVLHKYFQTLGLKYNAYEAEDAESLESAIRDIDSREKKTIKYTETIAGYDYSRVFIIIALVLGLFLLIIKNLRVHE